MATLWLRFAEDSSLPASMDAEARRRFETIFDAASPASPWREALALLRLRYIPFDGPLVTWHGDTPYINWSAIVQLISAGIITPVPDERTGFSYKMHYRCSQLIALLRSQWSVARYISRVTEPDYTLPVSDEHRIRESIALGLALLALTMRLPAHTPQQLANWLAKPSALPLTLRRTITQMQRLQQLRSGLSIAWRNLFSGAHDGRDMAPEYFWNVPPATASAEIPPSDATSWNGLNVAGNSVNAQAVLMTRETTLATLQTIPRPRILIFPLARPETVEWFEHADAVLFGEGGVMSHACTIAREMNLPCITGLGKAFISQMKASDKKPWLGVDPQTGTVTLLNR